MADDIYGVYRTRHEQFAEQLVTTKKKINLISNLRLAIAVVFIILLYYSFTQPGLFILLAVLIGLFFHLVKNHASLFAEKSHLENLVLINFQEMNAWKGDLNELASGSEFIDSHHPYTHDLDMFGDGSFYQYANRCHTHAGKQRFAATLRKPLDNALEIERNQDAIKDLAPRIEFRQHFQASGMEANEQKDDIAQLMAWVAQPPFLGKSKLLGIALIAIPVLTILALIIAIIYPQLKGILFLLIITQWILTAVYLKRINVFHDYISRKKNILQKYSRLLFFIEREDFNAEELQSISRHAHEAYKNVEKLASLVGALDARTNVLAAIFVNSFLMYDLQCVYRLEQWRAKNGSKLSQWLNAISEAEVLNSFGTFYYNNPEFCFAQISNELSIRTVQMGHPLLDRSERVSNDYEIGPSLSVHIITGANMAGKSTFLRTLGINMVLALNGAPVCARSFQCPVIDIRSGMRTADSLKDHQSYFFAELNRLKSIMVDLRAERPLLILLDEILKGTNSNDKQAGSIALVKQLLPHPCLAVIATHDLALGDLEHEYPEKVKNYSFEATIEDDVLSFDYTLKPGTAKKMNASYLMRKMGIIPEG